jgi:hypothetical protein
MNETPPFLGEDFSLVPAYGTGTKGQRHTGTKKERDKDAKAQRDKGYSVFLGSCAFVATVHRTLYLFHLLSINPL